MALSAQDYIILSSLNYETKQTNEHLVEITELLEQILEKLDQPKIPPKVEITCPGLNPFGFGGMQ
jgi:hypothetical protein